MTTYEPGRRGPGGAATRMVQEPIRIVLGEDNFIAREGIVRVLTQTDGFELAAACQDFQELWEAVARLNPDVVLTDVRMPPTQTDEGIRLAHALRLAHPDVGVVVLSQHIEPHYALALFEDGAEGRAYLLKDRLRDREELGRAIREVAAGGSLVDPRVVDVLLTHWGRRAASPLARLTPRELETLALLAEGRSNHAIAERLAITDRAVERHINSIFTKLELADPAHFNRRVKAALMYLADQAVS
jgi:DNA-binding NarL/FixJ family response regulator